MSDRSGCASGVNECSAHGICLSDTVCMCVREGEREGERRREREREKTWWGRTRYFPVKPDTFDYF